MRVIAALGRLLRQAVCRHNLWVSDYLWIVDERGQRFVLDYCSRCGKRDK